MHTSKVHSFKEFNKKGISPVYSDTIHKCISSNITHLKGLLYKYVVVHSGQKCFIRVACLWSKMPMLQRAGMREGGKPLPLAFQHLILMIWRPCDLNLVMISSLASKCQDFKVVMPFFQPFCVMKLKTSKFKVLAFWSQWRYHYQIKITRSLYHKNQILKC